MLKDKIKQQLISAQQGDSALFSADLEIETVEFFDQNGLMGGHTPLGVFELNRPKEYTFEFVALYINGILAYFLEKPGKNEIVLFDITQNLKGILEPIGR